MTTVVARARQAACRVEMVAGVDSSTQSCKVELRDARNGELLATGSAPHKSTAPPVSEQDPEMWWVAFVRAFRNALEAARASAEQVVALAVGAQCHGLVVLDTENRVIRPAKLWNDTTSAPQMGILLESIGAEEFIRSTGSLPTAAFTISKLAWLRQHEPENYRRIRRILLPHDYLNWRLTGEYVTDRSEASGTGYFDADAMTYLDSHLARIDPDRDFSGMLPEVRGPEEAAGTVIAPAREALGLRKGTPVSIGGGDQHISALGLGIKPGDVVYSFGTSGVVLTTHPDPVRDRHGIIDGVADCTGGYLPLVSTLNSAKVIATFAEILGTDFAELSRLALTANPDTTGPSLAAFLDGERKPNRPHATGVLAGLTTATTREEVARAAFEGVILGLVNGQAQFESLGLATGGRTLAIGGGARSPAMSQLLADVLRTDVLFADAPEAVARGAAVQASALMTSTPVAERAREWAPPTDLAASPRVIARDPWPEYRKVTAVTAHDRQEGIS